MKSRRSTYTYDAEGNRTRELDEDWNGSSWMKDYRWTYTYDAEGNRTRELNEYWDGNSWVKSSRFTYTYDAEGNRTEWLREDWNGSSWVKNSRWTYTYDAEGNLTREISGYWDGNSWVKSGRDTYTYDAEGNRTRELDEYWGGNSWVKSRRRIYTYDAEGNRTGVLGEDWNGSSWMKDYRWTYTYDAEGNRTRELDEDWDGGAWVKNRRSTYTYDAEGNRTRELDEDWDGSAWVKSSRSAYTYTYGVLLPPPERASADAAGESLALSWPAVPNDSLSGYRLYRSRTSFEDTSEATLLGDGLVSGTSYSDDGLGNGERYYYRLSAVSKSGLESGLSKELRAVPYPVKVSAEASRAFGDASGPGDYRLVALPGQVDTPLAQAFPGEAGADWQAYWHDGSAESPFVRYDGSETFNFRPGRGFWVTSRRDWTFDDSLSTVPLGAGQTAGVPLNGDSTWTIVSNPFGRDVAWQAVQAENNMATDDLAVPLWSFDESEGFVRADTMRSAASGEAYYYFNAAQLDSLRVPYPAAGSKAATDKKVEAAAAPATAPLALSAAPVGIDGPSSTVHVGLSEQERSALAPPGRFEPVSLRIANSRTVGPRKEGARSSRVGGYMVKTRPAGTEGGHTFQLRLEGKVEGPVRLSASGLEALRGRSASLIVPSTGQSFDLQAGRAVEVEPKGGATRLRLAVGSSQYVEKETRSVLPEEISLTSYPNPTRRQATVEYALPEAGEVTLQVYDVLGRRVATLADGEKQAGRHEASLRARKLPSGIYFGRLEFGGETQTQKITVVR
ncbi:T9SS type A sorting domain-containing protein [Salinibacter ruber]|uniref:T9SS type A sorting domain-containing protein n=1 Tax=Salinibacter ruber TaxID=146919 RepID=UPI00216A1674|nr:hypothetical protein [Salinibacter ruber]